MLGHEEHQPSGAAQSILQGGAQFGRQLERCLVQEDVQRATLVPGFCQTLQRIAKRRRQGPISALTVGDEGVIRLLLVNQVLREEVT